MTAEEYIDLHRADSAYCCAINNIPTAEAANFVREHYADIFSGWRYSSFVTAWGGYTSISFRFCQGEYEGWNGNHPYRSGEFMVKYAIDWSELDSSNLKSQFEIDIQYLNSLL